MYIPMVLLFGIAVFVTQLVFCIYAKKRWIKLLPICAVGAMELLCVLVYLLVSFYTWKILSALRPLSSAMWAATGLLRLSSPGEFTLS